MVIMFYTRNYQYYVLSFSGLYVHLGCYTNNPWGGLKDSVENSKRLLRFQEVQMIQRQKRCEYNKYNNYDEHLGLNNNVYNINGSEQKSIDKYFKLDIKFLLNVV